MVKEIPLGNNEGKKNDNESSIGVLAEQSQAETEIRNLESQTADVGTNSGSNTREPELARKPTANASSNTFKTNDAYDVAAYGDQKMTKISYFDPFGVFPELESDLLERLPLVNLHWNQSGGPLRSIPSLDVELVKESSESSQVVPHQMLGLSDTPYLKLIFVKCEDNDTYRSSVRRMIREWLSKLMSVRDPTEWLIIHYVPMGSRAYSGNRFRSGVFDKIRADFNSGSKKDRCIQIRKDISQASISEIEVMETWSDTMTKIKDGVLEAFTRRVTLYQEEVEKLEAKKTIMGWNYGTFFVMKEGLALSFENISLFEDALLVYDQLEDSFTQSMNQNNAAFFTSVGFDENLTDEGSKNRSSSSLLRLGEDKLIRHQIMANTISLFEFHCYLFARQASLLLYISKASSSASISALKIAELYGRLRSFISEIESLLLSNKKNRLLIAEWSYNVVKQFLKASESLPEGIVKEVSQGRGEMLMICRKSLETLGAGRKFYIEDVLSDVSLDDSESETEDVPYLDLIINRNVDIKHTLESPEKFYSKYRELTLAARIQFDLADRDRIVDRLSAQLALLDFQMKDYEATMRVLESIPRVYERQGWERISTYLLSKLVESLEKIRTGENSNSNKDKLFTYSLELLKRHQYLTTPEVATLLGGISDLSNQQTISAIEDNLDIWAETFVPPYIHCRELSHGTYLIYCDAKCRFKLQNLSFDYGTISLINERKEKITFRIENPSFGFDGVTRLEFEGNRFIQGALSVESIKFVKKKLSLIKDMTLPELSGSKTVQFYPSPDVLWASLKLSSPLDLLKKQACLIIYVKHDTSELKVRLRSSIPEVKLNPSGGNAFIVSQEDRLSLLQTRFVQPSFIIDNIKADSKLQVNIPFTFENQGGLIDIKVTIDYTTEQGTFQHSFSSSLNTDLAIDVNVLDFFRSTKLFSRFSVSCKDTKEPVRIEMVDLRESDHYNTSSPKRTENIAAFPGNPVSYSFCISHKENKPASPSEDLNLSIRHRYLRDGKYYWGINRIE
ncbi:Trs130p [Sugiyamaella lignohabitans]|uniref:Trs130p n=1 Tax=Sugiyamaella lignohabitans TaxID=796027 RepID=A0A170QXR3_9ASCO|nr:Trs130p [Sugiyamaella lignohabitans]ANB15954.1 Trs130p [Sugiyamaella lignohabitans]